MSIRKISAFSSCLLLLAASGFASNSTLSSHDQDMLKKLSQGNIGEVELGRLAEQKASDPAVKAFGQRMVKDHSRLETKVSKMASSLGVTLPKGTNSEMQSAIDELSQKSGKDFDQSYMKHMLMDHQKDISEVQQFSQSTQNPEMKSLSKKTLPVLKGHMSAAKNAAGKVDVAVNDVLNQMEQPRS